MCYEYEWCTSCGKRDYKDKICYSCCSVGVALRRPLCERCALATKLGKCSKCGNEFCLSHGYMGEQECCGLVLCGLKSHKGSCTEKHITKELKCGHTGCNLWERKGCRVCALEKEYSDEKTLIMEDKKLVKDLLKISKSKNLKLHLQKWLENLPETNKKSGISTKTAVTEKLTSNSINRKRGTAVQKASKPKTVIQKQRRKRKPLPVENALIATKKQK